jgi:hypothetical protein
MWCAEGALTSRRGEGGLQWTSLCRGEGDGEWKDNDRKQGPFSPGRGRRSRQEILPLVFVFVFAFNDCDYDDCKREEGGDERPLREDQENEDDAPSLDAVVSRKSDRGEKEKEKREKPNSLSKDGGQKATEKVTVIVTARQRQCQSDCVNRS